MRVTEVPLTGAQIDEKRTQLLEGSEKRITGNTLGDTPAKSSVGHGFPAEAWPGLALDTGAVVGYGPFTRLSLHVIPVFAQSRTVTAQKLIADKKQSFTTLQHSKFYNPGS